MGKWIPVEHLYGDAVEIIAGQRAGQRATVVGSVWDGGGWTYEVSPEKGLTLAYAPHEIRKVSES